MNGTSLFLPYHNKKWRQKARARVVLDLAHCRRAGTRGAHTSMAKHMYTTTAPLYLRVLTA